MKPQTLFNFNFYVLLFLQTDYFCRNWPLTIFTVTCLLASVIAPSPFAKHFNSFIHPHTPNAFSSYGPFGPFGTAGYEFASSSIQQLSYSPLSQQSTLQIAQQVNQPVEKREVFDVVFEWNILDFMFESPKQRQEYLESQEFVPENNLPLGIDRWRNKLFITTPRWRLGAPASLSSISLESKYKNPPLEPYPYIGLHSTIREVDCKKLVSVYRTFVDECDRLWVIDAGVVETLTNFRQVCPPKIVIFDLINNFPIVMYELPDDQALQGSLFTSIVVDVPKAQCDNAIAYVTDVWRYGIIVYSFNEGRSWRTTSHLHYPDPLAADMNFQGINFQWTDGTFGLSLGPQDAKGDRTIFFHPMASYMEFMVNSAVLKNESNWINVNPSFLPVAQEFVPIGSRGKRGQSSTAALSKDGIQFHNLVQRAAIGCWDIRKPYSIGNLGVVEQDDVKINFPNDIKIDRAEPQHIWVFTNNLPVFLYSTLDYEKINFRILTSNVRKAVAGTVCDPNATAAPRTESIVNCS